MSEYEYVLGIIFILNIVWTLLCGLWLKELIGSLIWASGVIILAYCFVIAGERLNK